MGFMDKVKSVGKDALKGALTMAAHSYGNVVAGKHKICKVSMNNAHDKLIFIKVTNIEQEYVIADCIDTFWVVSEEEATSYSIGLKYVDGSENSTILMMIDKKKGEALSTAEERLAAQFSDIAKLVEALATRCRNLDGDTASWANKIMRFANINKVFEPRSAQ